MEIIAYTDGACSTNTKKGGWAVVYEIDGTDEIVTGNAAETTNNRMELTAVLTALKKANEMTDHKFTIYTDSGYISNCFSDLWYIKWIANGWKSSKKEEVKNRDLWQQIIELYLNNKERISILKVKGHGDNKGNILADKLAVAAKERPISEE